VLASTQGKLTLKKPERGKAKRPAQGDQQNLRRGAKLVLAPKIAKKVAEDRATKELTKKITARIEATMASRASTDGGGLLIVKEDADSGTKHLRPNASVLAKSKSTR
jgi:hypothetical protein